MNALPESFRKEIHRSQLKRYEDVQLEEFFGHELSALVKHEKEWIRQAGDFPGLKNTFKAVLKVFVFFRATLTTSKGFNKTIRSQQDFFVELSQRFREIIPVHSFAKLIGIDESTFRQWIRRVRVRCSDSLINICRKTHPNQLLTAEIKKMKALLADDEFRFWPLQSVYYYALKNKIVLMGKSTWYKYAALLNVLRQQAKTIKTKTSGILALKPNEIWHADVTYFFTPDRIRYYIYTVVDNFSRFPLSVEISEKLCGKFRVQTFRNALRKALELDPSTQHILLMTDGGSENFNGKVTDFLKSVCEIPIHQIKALSDGWPSNSMAEALNKTIKNYYLNHMCIRTFSTLKAALEFTIEDYSLKRPNGVLKGLTPFEAYTGKNPSLVSFADQLKNARLARIAMNQNHSCSGNCLFK